MLGRGVLEVKMVVPVVVSSVTDRLAIINWEKAIASFSNLIEVFKQSTDIT